MKADLAITMILSACVCGAETPTPNPLYTVTVLERTTKAINYGYKNGPTRVDFQGTVVQPDARGAATVDSRRGVTGIEAKFSRLEDPARYGGQYLTYVLWALTPEGRAMNLGEVILDPRNKGKLNVATGLQAFALIVTAEPYYSVSSPSGVVVMENVVRQDTVGKAQDLNVRYELLPPQPFTFDTGAAAASQNTPKVSMSEYEALLALYQAQNAIRIARAAGADREAADSLRKAEELYRAAEGYRGGRSEHKQVVIAAREAVQAAEDARLITLKRRSEATNQAGLK